MNETDFDSVIENAPVMWRKINSLGIILDCNNTYAKKLGYDKEEVIGKSIFEHISDEDWDALKKSLFTWSEEGEVSNMNLTFKKKDGSKFKVLLNANSIFDEYGNLSGSNTMIFDVSEQSPEKSNE